MNPAIGLALIVCCAVLGLAGTDLVLPAVPSLPAALGGTPAEAQLVLAAFVAGSGGGLLLFGELGARFNQRVLLVASLALYGLSSLAAALAPTLPALIVLRLAQGATGSAAAVFAPGMIRALYSDQRAVRAIGLLASIESVVPALAPIAGVWLLAAHGWRGSFLTIAVLALLAALAILALGRHLPAPPAATRKGGYRALLRDAVYLRYALSQACTVGALLTFVFGAPAVITGALQGTLTDFILMQVSGIAFFIAGANLSGPIADRIGPERAILAGSALSALGACGILAYALLGGTVPLALVFLFVPMNLGLGLRGPPGFFRAVLASHGDDARGAALVILAILSTTAIGTAAAAPCIAQGLAPLAAIAAAISLLSVALLLALPALERHSISG